MSLLHKPVTAVVPFSGLGFDLTRATLAAAGTRLVRRDVETVFPIAPPPTPQRPQWGYELMVFLGRETGGS